MTRQLGFVGLLMAGCLAAACGGSARGGFVSKAPGQGAPSEAPASEAGPASQPSYARGGSDGASAPAPTATTGAAAEERAERAADSEQRPGLGTTWGETRASQVSSSPFEREDPSSPVALTSVFYNDEAGIRAMTRERGASWTSGGFTVAGGQFSVRLADASGNTLDGAQADGRNFVVGRDGERYTIQVRNNTGNRVEVVATVDGLDVVDGRPGALTKRGYILSPFATLEIDGFRRSYSEVASFRFGRVDESYAAKKGEDRNVGVIGIAFFGEAGSRWPWTSDEVRRRNDADPFPGRFATPPSW